MNSPYVKSLNKKIVFVCSGLQDPMAVKKTTDCEYIDNETKLDGMDKIKKPLLIYNYGFSDQDYARILKLGSLTGKMAGCSGDVSFEEMSSMLTYYDSPGWKKHFIQDLISYLKQSGNPGIANYFSIQQVISDLVNVKCATLTSDQIDSYVNNISLLLTPENVNAWGDIVKLMRDNNNYYHSLDAFLYIHGQKLLKDPIMILDQKNDAKNTIPNLTNDLKINSLNTQVKDSLSVSLGKAHLDRYKQNKNPDDFQKAFQYFLEIKNYDHLDSNQNFMVGKTLINVTRTHSIPEAIIHPEIILLLGGMPDSLHMLLCGLLHLKKSLSQAKDKTPAMHMIKNIVLPLNAEQKIEDKKVLELFDLKIAEISKRKQQLDDCKWHELSSQIKRQVDLLHSNPLKTEFIINLSRLKINCEREKMGSERQYELLKHMSLLIQQESIKSKNAYPAAFIFSLTSEASWLQDMLKTIEIITKNIKSLKMHQPR